MGSAHRYGLCSVTCICKRPSRLKRGPLFILESISLFISTYSLKESRNGGVLNAMAESNNRN